MKIVGFSGSSLKNGECPSERLLNYALEEFTSITNSEMVMIRISDYNLIPCKACGMCMKGLGCPLFKNQKDDLHKIVELMYGADAFIFSSPVYKMQSFSYPFANFWERSRIIFEKEHCDEWGIEVEQVEYNPLQYKAVANIITFNEGGASKLAVDVCERIQMGFRFTNEISLGIYIPIPKLDKPPSESLERCDIVAAKALGNRLAEIVTSELCMVQLEIINGKQMCI